MQSSFNTNRPMDGGATAVPSTATTTLMPSHDMRQSGLGAASKRLQANSASLDVVFEARAKADVVYCPVCPVAHEF